MPCSAVPNWPPPASTPQRSIAIGRSNAWPYSRATASEASLVAPYREIGAVVGNVSDRPAADAPAGHAAAASGANRRPSTASGSAASAGTLYTPLAERRTGPAPHRFQEHREVDG